MMDVGFDLFYLYIYSELWKYENTLTGNLENIEKHTNFHYTLQLVFFLS